RAVDDLERDVRALTVIPGSGEFFCATTPILRGGDGVWAPENVHTRAASTDWLASMDEAQAHFPNMQHVGFVVGWFGTDLRADHCAILPAVDSAAKTTLAQTWQVSGVGRQNARVVAQVDGAAAYGGTPSDDAVVEALADLRARNLKTTYYPFVFMDIAAGNTLPDPYGGGAQAAFPWRGRITSMPEPEAVGSPQGSAGMDAIVQTFLGTAQPEHFSVNDGRVSYVGPPDFGYRRFILHNAHLCALAGGVDTFLLGSELRGLTRLRNADGAHPFVEGLRTLAAQVRAILGPQTKLTYGADWSEFFGYQPQDGSGDVFFNLDPLWADVNIDAVGIDCYWPLADWRDGDDHLDARAGHGSIYDQAYLQSNIGGGEYYEWYYASQADRDAQVRTTITDGGGDPWIYRAKDIRAWWENQHFDRRAGQPVATPSPWVPQSKPFWFTEIGCPAVDRGANQPNVFYDPKSSESRLPYYASERRDDFMQRAYLRAFLDFYTKEENPARPEPLSARNPMSSIFSGRMVDPDRLYLYAWDARPYPAFPLSDVWSDRTNWQFGHWLNGRVGAGPLQSVVSQMFTDFGCDAFDVNGLEGLLEGYVLDRPMTFRQALQPLELAFACNTVERSAGLAVVHRGQSDHAGRVTLDNFVAVEGSKEDFSLSRAELTSLPAAVRITYID
ncbi:MAG: glycoside hydrolase TIM-barrel-like domain-containing protein, partial [Pseudomonadota bacterium]